MRANFKLINNYFWKTIYGPILAFILPVILMGILGNIMRIQYVYPGIIALAILFIGLIALPLAIMEFKSSSLFKYIGSSPVNPVKFTIVLLSYYTFISVITGFIIMFSAMAIFPEDVFPKSGFKHGIIGGLATVSGFFSFYISSFIHLLLVITFGIAIATFAKTPQQALTIAFITLIPSMFLSGMILSVDIIAQSPTMQWISRFIPFRYTTGNLVISTTPIDQIGDFFEKIKDQTYWVKDEDGVNVLIHNSSLIFGDNQIIPKVPSDTADYSNKLITMISKIKENYFKGTWTPEISNEVTAYLANHEGSVFVGLDDPTFNLIKESYPNAPILANYKLQVLSSTKEIINYYNGNTVAPNLSSEEIQNLQIQTMLFKAGDSGIPPGGDQTLFILLFNNGAAKYSSNNNIFDASEAWAVTRIPDINKLKKFLGSYLDNNGSSEGFDPSRFTQIISRIQAGDTKFIDLFLSQTNLLYYQAERILNILLPLTFTGLLSWYSVKNFNWSSR